MNGTDWEERRNILYFYQEKDLTALKYPWSRYRPSFTVGFPLPDSTIVTACGLPEYWRRKKSLRRDKLKEILTVCLRERPAESYFLRPELCRTLETDRLLPPLPVLQALLSGCRCWQKVVALLPGEPAAEPFAFTDIGAEQAELLLTLISPRLAQINQLTVVTALPEAMEEMTEELYEEYGIPVSVLSVQDYAAQGNYRGRQDITGGQADTGAVVLDLRPDGRIPVRSLPEHSVYVDLWSDPERKRTAVAKRKDLHWLEPVNYLDTMVKSGYNNIVNQQGKEE